MSLRESTVKGVIWNGIDTFGQYIIQIAVLVILLRFLTPADFSLIEMLVVFSAISAVLLDSGMGQAIIRSNKITSKDLSSVFYFNVALGFVLYITLYFTAPYISDFYNVKELKDISRIYFLSIIINSFIIIQNTIFTKELNFKVLAKASLISSLISGTISVILAINGYGVWALVVQLLLHSLIKAVLLWFFSSWYPSFVFSWNTIKTLLLFSSKLMANGLLDTIFTNLQSLVIGKYFTQTDLGLYSQAKKIQSLPSQTLTQIIQKVTYPVLSKIQDNDTSLKTAYQKVIQMATYIVFPVMFFLIAVAENFFYVISSEEWLPAVQYFRPLCIIGILFPMQSVNNNIYLVKGRSGLLLKLSIIRRVLIVTSLVAGVIYGILILVWGLVIAYVITGFIFIHNGGKLINYSVTEQLRDVFPAFIVSLVLSYTIYFLGEKYLGIDPLVVLLFQAVIFFMLYTVFSVVFKIPSFTELIKIAKSLISKIKK